MLRFSGKPLAAVAVAGAAALTALGLVSAGSAHASTPAPATSVVQPAYSGTASPLGRSTSGLSLSLALAPRDPAALQRELSALYDPQSPDYHHWLSSSAYNARFAPTAAQVHTLSAYLGREGLKVSAGTSPFVLRATGAASKVDSAFHTTVERYRATRGSFQATSSAVLLPRSIASTVQGVVGLSSIGPRKSEWVVKPRSSAGKGAYGDGPDRSGTGPSQDVGLNNGAKVRATGDKGEGNGGIVGVFELSAYSPNDIAAWWKHFYGDRVMPKLVDIDADGGPVTPNCPAGDTCGPFDYSTTPVSGLDSADYSGDIEVEADIQTLLAMDPDASRVDVYNAPNDFTGQTSVDEDNLIAEQDVAPVISVSWAECEYDATGDSATPNLSYVDAERTAFEKMAAQGQSIFAASGDTGAYGCLRGSGYSGANVLDPASDPYMTGVGGTSFGSYDPGHDADPPHPTGQQTVWNPLNLCGPGQNTASGFCSSFGAGGGGDSTIWSAPSWERSLPGVRNPYSSSTCGASGKALCREVPDVSANADEFTSYAEYCTGDQTAGAAKGNPAGYPGDSYCKTELLDAGYPKWFGIGGTSLATPLWAGVTAEAVGYNNQRVGDAAPALFALSASGGARYFYDIVAAHHVETDNGLYPATTGYDQATGLGTPNIDTLVPALK